MASVTEICADRPLAEVEEAGRIPRSEHQGSEATRYLSAAAYLDEKFRKQVLDAVEKHPFKAVGPNYGCDLGVVVSHCMRARRITRIRDICLTALLLLLLVTLALIGDLSYLFTGRNYLDDDEARLLVSHTGALVLFVVLAVIVVFVELFIIRFRILARQVSKAGFADHNGVAPDAVKCLPREIAGGRPHNVIVYGGFRPFVGAGTTIGGWSFALRTDKGSEAVAGSPETPQAFDSAALYQHVAAEIEALNLPNLRIQPRIYVDGRSVRADKRFLPKILGRPRHHLDSATLANLRDQHGGSARWYLAVEITDWSGELVLTIFVRFQQLPKTLFVEANYALLTPFKKEFYRVDEEDFELRSGAVVELFIQAAVLTLWRLPTAPFRAAALAWEPVGGLAEHGANVRAVEHNPGYNYGAEASLRESVADQRYRVYFQRLDQDMHLKMVEKKLLDALVEFLDDHGIDTSGLRERETTILNNGVMISGGSLQAESLAVGDKAKAGTSRLQRSGQGGEGKKAA